MNDTLNDTEKRLDIAHFVEKAYLNYSMYVILDRALPNISDGLKPVQRRIIYAMSELGLKATSKYKKSARTIGDVLGKFHPHGDSACYEAMVLMAQNFSLRYPLIDGQGNWGSIDDPKSFAAMRYTEARLSAFAQSLLAEINQGTVDWKPNFDASLDEPSILPSKLPHILLNGTSGIAVGMSTDIPPHHLSEVIDACQYILKQPKSKPATLEDILRFIQGPDYPTGGIIVSNQDEIKQIYKTGSGSLRICSHYQFQGKTITITELPFQTSIVRIMEQLANQIQNKKLPWVQTIRDESDYDSQVRLVIELKSKKVDIQALMSHLFASTDLEKSYRVHLNMIGLNKKPQCKNLLQILVEWLEFRKKTTIKRLEYQADEFSDRLHILEGLMIAYLNIDEVIEIIRFEDHPKELMQDRFEISSVQANAILEMRLRNLAKLEEIKIKKESEILQSKLDEINHHLASDSNLKKLISLELKETAKEFTDKRKTRIQSAPLSKAIKINEMIPSVDICIVLSKLGWVRVFKSKEIEIQKLIFQEGDSYLTHACGKSNQEVCFIDNFGRSFSLNANTLIDAPGTKGIKAKGEPVNKYFNVDSLVRFISCHISDERDQYLLVSKKGFGFISQYENFQTRMKNGKALINLGNKKDQVVNYPIIPQKIAEDDKYLALLTLKGKLLIFALEQIPRLAKGKGNKLIGLDKSDDGVLSITTLAEHDSLRLTIKKKSKILDPQGWKEYLSNRTLKGRRIPKPFQFIESLSTIKSNLSKKNASQEPTNEVGKTSKMNSLFD